jgi:TrmH family RNA methyltransferase
MGGHFALQVREVAGLEEALDHFEGRLVCAVPRDGKPLGEADLSGPIGWLFGSEGRGVSAALQDRADLRVTIATAPGTESLNVAAAAAICLYEGCRRRGGFSTPAAKS